MGKTEVLRVWIEASLYILETIETLLMAIQHFLNYPQYNVGKSLIQLLGPPKSIIVITMPSSQGELGVSKSVLHLSPSELVKQANELIVVLV